MRKILIVDDSELNREMLASIFEDEYEIVEAEDGDVACKFLEKYKNELAIVFLDLKMPRLSGLDVLAQMRYKGIIDSLPVVLITGEATIDTDLAAYEYGADDIIYKPFASKIVYRRAMNLIEQYRKRSEMEAELLKRSMEVIENQRQLARMNDFLLSALGSIVEFRSLESAEHVRRVMKFTKVILEYVMSFYPKYELTPAQIELMSKAAALHDVGKIGIPDQILMKPGKLDSMEFDAMKKHTTYGCDILEHFKMMDNEFFKYCYDICRWHHEKCDGNGYPDGLMGDDIPIYCQAAAIADCFDALVSKRVYKEPVSCMEAFNMIIAGECGEFSETILDCFKMAEDELFLVYKEDNEDGEE